MCDVRTVDTFRSRHITCDLLRGICLPPTEIPGGSCLISPQDSLNRHVVMLSSCVCRI